MRRDRCIAGRIKRRRKIVNQRRTAVAARITPLALVLLGQGVVSLTSFTIVLALGRWAGEAALGIFALGWSCWFFASSLGDTLVATPYTYFVNQRPAPARDLAMIAFSGFVILAAVAAALLTGLWLIGNATLAPLWPALPLALTGSLMRELMRRHFLATGQTHRLVRLDIASSALQLAGVVALVATQRLSANSTLWVITLGTLIPVLPVLSRNRLHRLFAANVEVKHELARFFVYGRWLLLGGLCHVAGVQIYPWLAFAAGGARMAGVFAACIALVNLLAPVLTGLTNYFRPKFMAVQTQYTADDFAIYVFYRTALFLVPGLMLCVVLAVFGERALVRIYGVSFAVGAPALLWFGVATVAVCLSAPLQLGLLAMRATLTNVFYHAAALACVAFAVAVIEPQYVTLLDLAHINATANWVATIVLSTMFFFRLVRV